MVDRVAYLHVPKKKGEKKRGKASVIKDGSPERQQRVKAHLWPMNMLRACRDPCPGFKARAILSDSLSLSSFPFDPFLFFPRLNFR